MSFPPDPPQPAPRMLLWLLLTVALVSLALLAQRVDPGSVIAVTLYKAHLMSLGGWGGYWLDRALFPYDRPHEYLADDADPFDPEPDGDGLQCATLSVQSSGFHLAMMRRALIVAACLMCVGLGA